MLQIDKVWGIDFGASLTTIGKVKSMKQRPKSWREQPTGMATSIDGQRYFVDIFVSPKTKKRYAVLDSWGEEKYYVQIAPFDWIRLHNEMHRIMCAYVKRDSPIPEKEKELIKNIIQTN